MQNGDQIRIWGSPDSNLNMRFAITDNEIDYLTPSERNRNVWRRWPKRHGPNLCAEAMLVPANYHASAIRNRSLSLEAVAKSQAP
jgi:hypothetical protein